MTIYTDQVTGKKYDRVHGGVAGVPGSTQGYKPCSECAFGAHWEYGDRWEYDAACDRAVEHCTSIAPSKTVFFVFKERKA